MDVFFEAPCLTEKSKKIRGLALQKKWLKSADKRIIGQYIQKLVDYNSVSLEFLGVTPYIEGIDQNVTLSFRTSDYIGSVPLRSSSNGKQIGDFVVTPRFTGGNRYEDYIEILDLLDSEINPEFVDSLPLVSGRNFRPPLYLEAINYIGLLERLVKKSWRKFDNVERNLKQPSGEVNWNKYAHNMSKVENRTIYPSRKNILSQFHYEYSQLRYVFDICMKELTTNSVPIRIKTNLKPRLSYLDKQLYQHKPQATSYIPPTYSDSPLVKECKKTANKIINQDLIKSTAWRVDFSDVFEKFVQYIFSGVSKEIGGNFSCNYKLRSSASQRYSWFLSYLEPDVILHKNDSVIFIDAKYKSNMYNKHSQSVYLKDDHRHDLHQILAYASFDKTDIKNAIICYPSDKCQFEKISYSNKINDTRVTVYLCGIVFKRSAVLDAKKMILNEIYKINGFSN